MSKKKILIFSLAYKPFWGGAEIAIKEITDRISGIEFEMVTKKFDRSLPDEEIIGNINVYRINSPKLFFPFIACFKAWRLNRKRKYDGTWAMMANRAGFAAMFFKLLHPEVSYFLTLQEGDPFEYPKQRAGVLWFFIGWLFKYIFRCADYIQAISNYLAGWARDMKATCPIEVVPNAVNTAHFSQEFSNEEIKEVQKKLGKKEGDVFIVTTSRLVEKNAIDDVIKAMKFLDKNIKFIIFGTGPDEELLKNLAKKEGVEDRVYFRGYIDHKDMPLYLKACDIFTRPSRSEGFGNSFIEAMTAEIPVVTTQEGGIADFLFDEKRNPDKPTTGWAVDKNSPNQIAEAIKDIVGRPEKTEKVLASAKKMAFEKYDWNIIAGDMQEKVFSRLFK